jgi:hypothetical protein
MAALTRAFIGGERLSQMVLGGVTVVRQHQRARGVYAPSSFRRSSAGSLAMFVGDWNGKASYSLLSGTTIAGSKRSACLLWSENKPSSAGFCSAFDFRGSA